MASAVPNIIPNTWVDKLRKDLGLSALATNIDELSNVVSSLAAGGIGGGGTSPIQTVTVTLTDAQIKALPTTPVTILAAPGTSKIIVPLLCSMRFDWHADYTNIDYPGGSFSFSPTLLNPLTNDPNGDLSSFLALSQSGWAFFGNAQYINATGTPLLHAITQYTNDDLVDIPLKLVGANGLAGNFTGGDPANSIMVTVYYVIIDKETGDASPGGGTDLSALESRVSALSAMGSGGASYMQKATVILNDAQIKALPTTPIEVIPAPGSNKVITIIQSIIKTNGVGDNPYSNLDADSFMSLIADTTLGEVQILAINDSVLGITGLSNLLSPAAGNDRLGWSNSGNGETSLQGWGIVGGQEDNAHLVNQSIKLKLDNNGAGDLTGGNAANTFIVTIFYVVYDVIDGSVVVSSIGGGTGVGTNSVTSNQLSTAVAAEAATRVLADNALSNAISVLEVRVSTISSMGGGGGSGSVTSNEVSAISAQAKSAIDVVSNAVSNETSNRISADNALSQAISVLSQGASVISTRLSNELSVRAASVQTASAAATSVDARVTSVNVFLSGISAMSVGGVSTHGLQSVVNALSNRISAVVAASGNSVTSNEVSVGDAAVSLQAASALSQALSVVSVAVAAVSTRIDTASALATTADTHANTASAAVTSVDARVNTISDQVSVISQQVSVLSQRVSVLSSLVSTVSIAVTSVDARVNTVSNLVSILSSQVSTVSLAVTSVDSRVNTVSNQVSTLSQQVSILSQTHSALSQQVSVLSSQVSTVSVAVTSVDTRVNTVSNLVSILSGVVSVVSIAITSVDTRVNTVSQQASVLSQQVSVISALLATVSTKSAATSVHGLQSVINALSNRISATGGGSAHPTSNEFSILSQAVSVADAALSVRIDTQSQSVSVISQQVSALSQVHSVLSQQVSVLSSQVSTVSIAVTSVDTRLNTVSNQVSVLSQQVSILSQGHSALSQQVSALSSQVSTVSAAVTSVDSRVNTVSNLVSVLSSLVSVVSIAITSVDTRVNTVSNQVSILSQQVSVLSQSVSVLSVIGDIIVLQNNDGSAVSAGAPIYAFTSALTFKRANASVVAAKNVLGLVLDNSIAVSATGRVQMGGTVTLTTGQWDNVTGQTGGLTPGSTYYLDISNGLLTTTAPATGVVRQVGIALSTTIMRLQLNSLDDLTSALNVVSNAVSALSQATSVQAAALSVRIDTQSQSVSVISQQVSALSQVHSALSQQVSVLSSQVSTVSIAVTSVDTRVNTVSNQVSIISQQVSILSQGHSALSQQVSALSSQVSVVSVAVTSVDTRVNTVSNLVSVLSSQVSTVSLAVTSVDTRLNTVSNLVSVLSSQVSTVSIAVTSVDTRVNTVSNQVSIISAGLGGVQMKVVGNAQNLTVSAFTNVSGLSISVASAAAYDIIGKVLFTLSAAAGVASFGFTYPAGIANGGMEMFAPISVFVAGTTDSYISTAVARGYIAAAQMSTLATAQLSAAFGSSAVVYMLNINGLILNGATPGTIQLQAKGAATPTTIQILQGSYLRAFKIS